MRRTMICTTVTAQDMQGAVRRAERALSLGSDLVELRLDMLEDPSEAEAHTLLGKLARRLILTLRPARQGGGYEGRESERLRLLSSLSRLRPAYVDIESDSASSFRPAAPTRLIVSWHFLDGTPPTQEILSFAREAAKAADVVKVVTRAESAGDNAAVFSLYSNVSFPLVAFCMGEGGRLSRILSLALGAPLAYSCLPGERAAPGQLTLSEMLALRRVVQNS